MKKWIGASLGVALLGWGCFAFFRDAAPQQVAANVIITEAGRYRSPNGKHLVEILPFKDGG